MPMYAIVGNGEVNATEAIKTLESLWDTAVDTNGQDFWLTFVNDLAPSETMQTIWAWANKMGVYYEVLCSEKGDLHPLLAKNENLHKVSDSVIDHAVDHIKNTDDAIVLVLGGTNIDAVTLKLAQEALQAGVPVYDLAGQMMELEFVSPPETEAEQATIDAAEQEFTEEPVKTKARPRPTNGQPTPVDLGAAAAEGQVPAVAQPESAKEVLDRLKAEQEEVSPTPEPQPQPQAEPNVFETNIDRSKTLSRVVKSPAVLDTDENMLLAMTRQELKDLMATAMETASAEHRELLEGADRRSTQSMTNALLGLPLPPKRMNKNNKDYPGNQGKTQTLGKAAFSVKLPSGSHYYFKVVAPDGLVREYPLDSSYADQISEQISK